jgi:hypothetical protein
LARDRRRLLLSHQQTQQLRAGRATGQVFLDAVGIQSPSARGDLKENVLAQAVSAHVSIRAQRNTHGWRLVLVGSRRHDAFGGGTVVVFAKFALVILLTQDTSAAVRAREVAEVHFKLGNEALLAGEAERAIAEYTSAHQLFPSAKILVNLGQAFERTGSPAQALWCFEQVLEARQDTDGSADLDLLRSLAIARRRRQALGGKVTAEKPTQVNGAVPAHSPPSERPPVPIPAPPAPRPAPALLSAPLSAEAIRPAPPSRKTKWIIAGAVAVTSAVATFFLVRAIRSDCPVNVCVPSD